MRRAKHIDVEAEFKVATRHIADTVDDDGLPVTWAAETYLPAHVWVIKFANGSEFRFHHDSGLQLLEVLTPGAKALGVMAATTGSPDDSEDGGDSGAVLIKLNNYEDDNVRSEAPIGVSALQRVVAAVRAGTLTARKNDDNLRIR